MLLHPLRRVSLLHTVQDSTPSAIFFNDENALTHGHSHALWLQLTPIAPKRPEKKRERRSFGAGGIVEIPPHLSATYLAGLQVPVAYSSELDGDG